MAKNTKTWKLDLEKNQFSGTIDGVEAVKQAVYFTLNTERFRYPIFTWNYGVEIDNLIGKPRSYVEPLIGKRITEALIEDDRITAVDDFNYSWTRSSLLLTFTVYTIYGKTNVEWEGRI